MMKKSKSTFVCQNCGFHSPKWVGKCPNCGEWSTMIEEIEESKTEKISFPPSAPMLYEEVKQARKQRLKIGIDELNQVLGGGVVLGSLVLIGGEPGIGKSTLLLQVSRDFSSEGKKVLYVSSEESLEQIKMRGERLGIDKG
ncbi:MAG: ATPase domain-containing protein, partial [Acidobacteriota bacterium]